MTRNKKIYVRTKTELKSGLIDGSPAILVIRKLELKVGSRGNWGTLSDQNGDIEFQDNEARKEKILQLINQGAVLKD